MILAHVSDEVASSSQPGLHSHLKAQLGEVMLPSSHMWLLADLSSSYMDFVHGLLECHHDIHPVSPRMSDGREKRGLHKDVNTRRWGSLWVIMEAGHYRWCIRFPLYTVFLSFGCATLENLANIVEKQFSHLVGFYLPLHKTLLASSLNLVKTDG